MSTDDSAKFTYMLPFVLVQGMFEVEGELRQLLLQGLQQLVAGRLVWDGTERLCYEERFCSICI